MRLAVLLSGGKDSVYAAWLASRTPGCELACLVTLRSANPSSWLFHTPAIELTALQAEAMGLPHFVRDTPGEKEGEVADLVEALRRARDEHGAEGVVTGAIGSVYQAERVQRACRDLGLWCFNPLWQADQLAHLRALLEARFDVVVTGVFAEPLDASWLGAHLDEGRVAELARLAERWRINPAGEGGELETLVLDCPLFKRRLEIVSADPEWDGSSGVLRVREARLVAR